MYLKSLTLRGFKSFARKTVLDFEPGVTVVVGPNGSGKSNIADAVMWVLGEQRPLHLRGGKMEDVIFSGSALKSSKNMAEVVLTLDNSNREFPFEFSEVTISRNILRSGDSEYRLNGRVCRLYDIQELLADTGVGRSLNAVVSQGQLEEVLTCRPDERRSYLEEAAGLLKFRRRKEKALRRLDRMEAELVRIGDIISEVKKHMRPLKRQARRLEDHQELARELKEGRLRIEVGRLRKAQGRWQEHVTLQDERKKHLAAMQEELNGLKKEIAELGEGVESWMREEEPLRRNEYRIVSCHEKLKAFSRVLVEKRKSVFRPPAVHEDLLALAGVRSLEEVEEELSKETGRLDDMRESRDTLKVKVENLSEALRLTRERLDVVKSDRQQSEASETGIRNDLLSRKVALEATVDEYEKLEGRVSERESQADSLRSQLEQWEEGVESESGDWQSLWSLRRNLEDRKVKTYAILEAIDASRQDMEKEEADLVAKLHVSEKLDSPGNNYASTASFLLQQGEASGLTGPLLQDLKVDYRYEKALYSYLGPWLFALAAEDVETITKNIKFLKQYRAGRSLFFKGGAWGKARRSLDFEKSVNKVKGAVWARSCVEAPRVYRSILDALLGDCYIVEDLDNAFRLSAKEPKLNFLTLEGDVVSSQYLAKGGSQEVNPVHRLMGQASREEMAERLGVLEEELIELQAERKKVSSSLEELDEEVTELEKKLARRYKESDPSVERGSDLRARIGSLEREIGELRSEMRARNQSRREMEKQKVELETLLSEWGEELSRLTAEEEESGTETERLLSQLREFEPELYSLESEIVVSSRRVEYLEELFNRFKHSTGLYEGGSPPDPDLASGHLDRLEALHERLGAVAGCVREKLRVRLEEGMTEYRDVESRLRERREALDVKSNIVERMKEEIHQEDVAQAELKVRVEEVVKRIVDEHKVSLEFALKQYRDEEPYPDLEARVEELAGKLERLGPVNPEAISEYKALKERHDFLNSQVEDVRNAQKSLKKVIREIDARMRMIFRDTHEDINRHFQEIFSYLFPQGRAEIILTEPDDPLNSGVEILAQPQGKRLRRLSLLSGGERALTAIAFFFSLFRVRPSPFYFMDEVEAALDDLNLGRFLGMVNMFKSESQLVLITHQKHSMEIADVLYGVTMHEDGVSKVISQRVGEAVGS